MRASLVLTALLASGCTTWVPVRHTLAPRDVKPEGLPALGRMVIVMQLPAPGKPGGPVATGLKEALQSLADKDSTAMALPVGEALAEMDEASIILGSPSSRVVAYMTDSPAATIFADSLGATSILWLKPSAITAAQEKFEAEESSGGKKRVREGWAVNIAFSIAYRLESWPGRVPLASRVLPYEASVTSAERLDLPRWLREQEGIRRAWAVDVTSFLLPRVAFRNRKLMEGKSKALKDGCKLANDGRWNEAGDIWMNAAVDDPDYKLRWDLGIYHERAARFAEARDWYSRALAANPGREEQAALSGYIAEIDRIFVPSQAPPSDAPQAPIDWFETALAVVPFGNSSNSVDAPDRARAAVWKALSRKGYRMVRLEDSTRMFRDLGITQGEQAKAFKPADIARAAGAGLLLTGTVADFRTVNVGLYVMKAVGLELRLVDATGRVLWSGEGWGSEEQASMPADAGKAFLGGLFESAVEKAARVYLERELQAAVMNGLAPLPSYGSR